MPPGDSVGRPPSSLLGQTHRLIEHALTVYSGTAPRAEAPVRQRLMDLRRRLDAPLRVAVAGRVKAGKSTLLNALIGERLAPTDAGECTRVVTWYTDGHTYQVTLTRPDGSSRQARFGRQDGPIEIDLAGEAPDQLHSITISWPSQALRRSTLIDTPGIGSLSEQIARRTWELLASDDEVTPADAVIYLMTHAHRDDVEFLAGFHDREVSRPNPVNAIAVLSRADEIGAGRADALRSAAAIARRLAADPQVRRVAQTVVPVAGLLAQTATTLTEREAKQLELIAALPAPDAELLLLSADRFVTTLPDLGLSAAERTALLDRFGLFGLRAALTVLRRRTVTASELARELTAVSGLDDLNAVLQSLFHERAELLKSRSALLGVDALVRRHPVPGATALAAAVEQILAGAHPLHELRVLSSLRAGWVTGRPEVLAELEQVIGGAGQSVTSRLGLPPDAGPTSRRQAATSALLAWQRRAESPLCPRQLAVAARVAIRTCEGIITEESGGHHV